MSMHEMSSGACVCVTGIGKARGDTPKKLLPEVVRIQVLSIACVNRVEQYRFRAAKCSVGRSAEFGSNTASKLSHEFARATVHMKTYVILYLLSPHFQPTRRPGGRPHGARRPRLQTAPKSSASTQLGLLSCPPSQKCRRRKTSG